MEGELGLNTCGNVDESFDLNIFVEGSASLRILIEVLQGPAEDRFQYQHHCYDEYGHVFRAEKLILVLPRMLLRPKSVEHRRAIGLDQ